MLTVPQETTGEYTEELYIQYNHGLRERLIRTALRYGRRMVVNSMCGGPRDALAKRYRESNSLGREACCRNQTLRSLHPTALEQYYRRRKCCSERPSQLYTKARVALVREGHR